MTSASKSKFFFNNFAIEPLTKEHDLLDFDCSSGHDADADLNDFIKNDALNQNYEGWNRTYVLVEKGKKKVLGFYAISNDSFNVAQDIKTKQNKPYQTIPATKIARLAVDKNYQHKGVGTFLIKYAIGFVIDQICKNVGCRYITLDAYPHKVEWYKKFGFIENTIIPDPQPALRTTSLILDLKNYPEKLRS